MSFLTDRPIGTVISLNDKVHVVDVDDLTDSPFGTSKQYTLSQIKTILDSDNQDLENVLSNGFTTGANDISINDGQKIINGSGNSSLELSSFGFDFVTLRGNLPSLLLTDFGVSISTDFAYTQNNRSEWFISGNEVYITLGDTLANKTGTFYILNNESADKSSPFNTPNFPAEIASQNFNFKQGVVNAFVGGGLDVIVKTNNTSYSNKFGFNSGEAFETILNYTTATANNVATLQNASGTIAYLSDITGGNSFYSADDTVGAGRIATLTDTLEISKTTQKLTIGGASFLDIEVAQGTGNPLSLYQNRVGGANNGDLSSFGFAFNDSSGVRRSVMPITARVVSTAVSSVNASLNFTEHLKVDFNGEVIISPLSLTASASAQFEVRGQSGVSNNITSLFVTPAATSSQIAIAASNGSQNLFLIQGDGKLIHNRDNLATADLQHKGFTDINLFYSDAGLDRVGIGTATAQISSKLTITGDTETLGNTNGFIVLDRTNATRYRIYSDGGVLSIEVA